MPTDAKPAWIRVTDRDTGHQYDVVSAAFDPAAHIKVNAPRQWPDLYGPGARPRPAKHRVGKGGQPQSTAPSTSTSTSTSDWYTRAPS